MRHIFCAILLLVFCVACGRPETQVGSSQIPLLMVLAPSYQEKVSTQDLETMGSFLQKETGLIIKVQIAKDPVDAIESFSGRSDVGLLNLFEFLLARQEYKVEPGLQVIRSGAASYVGEIVVKKESNFKTLSDLSGKNIAYVDAYSSSGFVFPAQLFAKEKVSINSIFAGSPEKALEQLKSGKVEAAAVYQGATKDDSLLVLASTASIPNEPIFFRAGLDPQKKEKLVAALQKFPATPDGARILSALSGITELKTTSADTYNEVDSLLQSSGQSAADLVQNGWRVGQPAADLVP